MNTTTQTQFCNIHHTTHNSNSLLERAWNRLSHSVSRERVAKDQRLQETVLKEQKEATLRNLAQRNSTLHAMIMRQIL